MTKPEFLNQLRSRLSGLPEADIAEQLAFYSEIIDDRMEEGLSEQDAVSGIGSLDALAAQITADSPPVTPTPKKRSTGLWLLLILGSPIWASLLIAVLAIVLSLYISLWAVIISLWAVFGSLAACALAGIAVGIGLMIGGKLLPGIVLLGAGLVCSGLSVFLYYGCMASSKGAVLLAKKLILWTVHRFSKKEDA